MRLKFNASHVRLWLSENDTYDWVHKLGAVLPCSTLGGSRLWAEFDSNGLCDLRVNGWYSDPENGSYGGRLWIDPHELNAITADFLQFRLPENHPAYLVAVGQFREQGRPMPNFPGVKQVRIVKKLGTGEMSPLLLELTCKRDNKIYIKYTSPVTWVPLVVAYLDLRNQTNNLYGFADTAVTKAGKLDPVLRDVCQFAHVRGPYVKDIRLDVHTLMTYGY